MKLRWRPFFNLPELYIVVKRWHLIYRYINRLSDVPSATRWKLFFTTE